MDIDELIRATVDQQPTRFANAFDSIMRQKIDARLEDESVAYAQQMFASDDPEDADEEEFEDDLDFDIDDEDFEDEDFEDEDFDIEDLDLEDLDLEDLDTEEDDDGEDA
jgi:hypothetical protein